ncbi:hypothetical protein SAMN05421666_2787 [Roseovarius nanhaiticus]|uniref:TFIIB zinc-binding n=1 Tax=Roseovarius nanhaiticus TaxID=573024 RepID=A0A1N7HD64_9RHOB|nr:hypothetical protein [Roseovarius nanhaiticus]SEL01514.1 hypothetical protein SAMN05216208_2528 [Roseovarius nanhaiticus]SIS22817.1 hypothetical protein SAMN05421666_2787 [Roseovarius nanhaiticus]
MRKIVTCCYCGTRAALVLRGDSRHELSCAACGAPLHEMKAMPCAAQERGKAHRASAPRRRPAPHPYDVRREDYEERRRAEREMHRQPARRRKRRKPFLRKAFEEIWDVVEDIFD